MKSGLRSIRALKPDSLRGVKPADNVETLPTFEWLNPRDLFVEEGYQRDVGERGVALIRKIYSGFDWSRFKPPVCVRPPDLDGVTVCIDGQHTAIACASHPGIEKIPVMVVSAVDGAARASAFVGHNRDRIALTGPAIYLAELAGGDPVAVMVDRACRAAGATVLGRAINLRDKQPAGSTIAIGTMKAIAKRQGEEFLTRVMHILVAAGRSPIKADEVGAVAVILANCDDGFPVDRLRDVIASQSTEAWAAIGLAACAGTREPLASAVAAAWCRQLNVRLPGGQRGASRKHSSGTQVAKTIPKAPRDRTLPREPQSGGGIYTSQDRVSAPPIPAKKSTLPEPALAAALRRLLPTDPPKTEPARPATVAPRPEPAPPAPPPGANMVRRNGVTLNLSTGFLEHRGRAVQIMRLEARKLVAALARVMPALLDPSRLASQTFGRADVESLRPLIAELQPELLRARLEIKTVSKIGCSLFDLG